MKILLAGATGFLGSNLVPVLVANGHEVTAVGRESRKDVIEGMGSRFVAANLADQSSIPPCGDQDVAIFLALSSHLHDWPEKAKDVIGVNVLGPAKFAEAARKSGARRLLHASSGSVYSPSFEPIKENSPLRSDNLYSLSQKSGEDIVRLYASYFEVLVFRVFYLYGPGQTGRLVPNIIQKVAEGIPIDVQPLPDEDPEHADGLKISITYVENAVRILNSLVDSTFKGAVNFSGQETISIRGLAESVGKLLGREPTFRISDTSRAGDMVADTRLLESLTPLSSWPFETCLGKIIEHG